MTKHNARGPADANNDGKVIKPTNTSRSFARGGGVMRQAEEQHHEHAPHDISGGSRAADNNFSLWSARKPIAKLAPG